MKRVPALVLILIMMFTPVMSAGEVDGATVLGQSKISAYIINDKDGIGHFIRGERLDRTFTGIAYNKDSGLNEYVENGVAKPSFTGVSVSINDGGTYAVINGKVDYSFTGLLLNSTTGLLEYVEKGKRNYTYTGIARNHDGSGSYFVKSGKVDYEFTGVAKNPYLKEWDYINKGEVDRSFTGNLELKNGRSLRIENGVVSASDYITRNLLKNNTYLEEKGSVWASSPFMTFNGISGKYAYLDNRLLEKGVEYVGTAPNSDALINRSAGVGMLRNGNYYYVNPSTGRIRRSEGFIESGGKLYYSEADGKLKRNTLFEVDGRIYGATEDASLAENGWIKVGQLYYRFVNYEVEDTCLKAKAVLDDIGYDLMAAYFWSGTQLPYYTFDANPEWGSKWFADFAYAKDRGNCYVMAATFYYYAKMLGYDAIQVAGEVYLPHSWVEIVKDGEIRVFDPERFWEADEIVYDITYDDPMLAKYHEWKPMPEVSSAYDSEG